ncbi:hypothetical protein BGZ88_000267, partial [Linnemannia elongata]
MDGPHSPGFLFLDIYRNPDGLDAKYEEITDAGSKTVACEDGEEQAEHLDCPPDGFVVAGWVLQGVGEMEAD